MMAAGGGHVHVAELLLGKGADVNAKDKDGASAMTYATRSCKHEMVKLLKDRGVNVTLDAAACLGELELVQRLMDETAKVDAKTQDLSIAVMCSASLGHPEVVKFLLETGADVDSKDREGATALMRAAEHGRLDVMRLLLRKGTAVDATNPGGETALFYACRASNAQPAASASRQRRGHYSSPRLPNRFNGSSREQ